ncbi:MAG: hypothetical protein WA734_13710 [Candidatus Acidiferrales bacterium]
MSPNKSNTTDTGMLLAKIVGGLAAARMLKFYSVQRRFPRNILRYVNER